MSLVFTGFIIGVNIGAGGLETGFESADCALTEGVRVSIGGILSFVAMETGGLVAGVTFISNLGIDVIIMGSMGFTSGIVFTGSSSSVVVVEE